MLQIYLRCLQILNIIRVLYKEFTSAASSLYSLGCKSTELVYKDIKACNYITCQKCEIIKFGKNLPEEPNSANYRMPQANLSVEELEQNFRI